MTDNTYIDIFAPPPPPPAPEDEHAIALKHDVDKFRVQLHAMIKSAPAEDDDSLVVEQEEWCQRWKDLIVTKGKGKQKSTPPANPTRTPTVTATSSSPNPRPTPILRQRLAAQAGPPSKATPAAAPKSKGKGKAEEVPAVAAAPERTAPGPSGILRPYVEILVDRNHKRKAVEIEEAPSESEEDEEDDEDAKDAYMASRVNGLHTFVSMFETAFGALKKEVTEIDGTEAPIHDERNCVILEGLGDDSQRDLRVESITVQKHRYTMRGIA
ncbi:hypothetical protein BDR05DRAFT_950304 [Suillus weaverae]|nr:hypothetical protein BDR05DRAFT_950304 [Suillus weaverae]